MTTAWDLLWTRVTNNDISVEEIQRIIFLLHNYDHAHDEVLDKLIFESLPHFDAHARNARIVGARWLSPDDVKTIADEHHRIKKEIREQYQHEMKRDADAGKEPPEECMGCPGEPGAQHVLRPDCNHCDCGKKDGNTQVQQ